MTRSFSRSASEARRVEEVETAVEAFLGAKEQFGGLVAELLAMSAEHFGAHPDLLDWADVGSLQWRVAKLREVCDSYHQRGEFAPEA